jgi:two-component system, OmpR family, response regulator QseB
MAYLLIVDDDEDFAAAVAAALATDGHEVHIELEIAPAIESQKQRRPDLVILDVMFPEDESAGFELARWIVHGGAKLGRVPILMLTAVNMKFPLGFGSADCDEYWLPVQDFIDKPVDLNVLRSRVSALLAQVPSKDGRDEQSWPKP